MANLKPQALSLWGKTKNYLYKHYGQESGKLILHTGLATWTVATLGQIVAIVFNKKIDSEQKKFLIPQEIFDGLINIAAFYTITNSIRSVSTRLVSTGKWSNAAIRDFVKKNPSSSVKMGEMATDLAKTYKGNEEFYKVYSPFKNGLEMIATTIGSITSSNLITPFLRNSIGAKQQKQSIEKENKKKVVQNPYSNAYQPSFASRKIIYPKTGMKI